ncbi:hypothetical protein GCM10020255_028210 [Rhodococcus baikonurensis]
MAVVRAAVTVLDTIWKIPYLAVRYSSLSTYVLALMTRTSTFDTTAARRDFGYVPVVDRDSGLLEFQDWVQSQGGIAEITRTLK